MHWFIITLKLPTYYRAPYSVLRWIKRDDWWIPESQSIYLSLFISYFYITLICLLTCTLHLIALFYFSSHLHRYINIFFCNIKEQVTITIFLVFLKKNWMFGSVKFSMKCICIQWHIILFLAYIFLLIYIFFLSIFYFILSEQN